MAIALLCLGPALCAQGPVITEFLAENETGILDADGEASDWIEVQNPGAAAASLEGWSLTDAAALPRKWVFPAVTLEPGEYRVVFASGKDRRAAGAELHTNFRLDSQGEYLALVRPDGVAATEFAPAFPPQRADVAFGLGRRPAGVLARVGGPARVRVPANGALGLTWTGDPFDDSEGAGWVPATTGVGYPGGGGPPPPQPIAYWSLDGSGLDAGSLGNDAILSGASYSSDVPAQLGGGKSASFDGADDFITAELDVSEAEHTLSLWFKADTANRGVFTVTAGDLGAGGYDRLLYLSAGNIAARVWNNETIASTGRNYADRRWHHLVHVVGPSIGGQRIYVDGARVATGVKSQSDFNWQDRVNIGFSNDASSPYFDGLIDDVAVWDAALTEVQIQALAAGASPLALSGLAPWVATDISAAMLGRNASAYIRVPFDLAAPPGFDSILLRIRYDDGFAAYLNGIEVARRNAPEALAYDSRALSDRPSGMAIRAEEIELAAFVGLLGPGRNLLALHGLNDRPDGTEFLIQPELVALDQSANRYLSSPTPGGPNGFGVLDFVAGTRLSAGRGFYSAPVSVEITTDTQGASIYYTMDGSEPNPGGPGSRLYTSPIAISRTTMLRAAAFKDELQPSDVETHTYIFPGDVVRQPANPPGFPAAWSGGFPADYEMDPEVLNTARPGYSVAEALLAIPSVSVTTDPKNLFDAQSGIYYNSEARGGAWERKASIELIRPDGARGFQVNAGIRMHGNSSRIHSFTPKHPIRIRFRREYGPAKLRFPLFDDSQVEEFDELLLRGASTDSWPVVDGGPVQGVQRWAAIHATYLRDQYMRDAQIAMGHPSGHGTYVHLYLNGLYWGVYNFAERPKSGFQAEHFGGTKEEYDVIKDFAELEDGTMEAWSALMSLAGAGFASDAAYQRVQGNNPDGTRNAAYPVYLDVDNLIDYMVLHIASGAEDWPHHNWWGARRRGAESGGFRFFVWDQEISNDSLIRRYTLFETLFENPVSSPCPSYLYGQLMANGRFRQRFIDRVHRHLFNDGLLTPGVNEARWLARQQEIDRAIVGESARWGDSKRAAPYKREVEWLNEMNFMHGRYWPEIRPIAVQRFRNVGLYPDLEAPVFEVSGQPRHGGELAPGETIAMTLPSGAAVIDVPLVGADDPVSAHVPSDDRLEGQWRAASYVEGSHGETWETGLNGVGYETTTGYESAIRIDLTAEMTGPAGNNTVYVRLPFTVPDQATLNSFSVLRLEMLYDDGFVAYLNGARVAGASAPADGALAWSSAATAGGEADLANPAIFDISSFIGALVVGQNLLAVHGLNFSTGSSDMLIRAELTAGVLDDEPPLGFIRYTTDGKDPMEPGAASYSGPISIPGTRHLKARTFDGAEWSALTEAIFVDPTELPLRVTEVMYHPAEGPPGGAFDEDEYEFIELENVGGDAVSLGGVRLRGAIEFDFTVGAVANLGPGEHVVLVEDIDAFIARYDITGMNIAGEYSGRLGNEGEAIALEGPIGEKLLEFRYDPAWYPETDGGGRSLVILDASGPAASWKVPPSWAPSRAGGGSPGQDDATGGQGGRQRVGDSNRDGILDLSDAVSLLFRLFRGSQQPLPCEGAALLDGGNRIVFDVNDDGAVNVTDALFILTHLFRSGPPPVRGAACVRVVGCMDACSS